MLVLSTVLVLWFAVNSPVDGLFLAAVVLVPFAMLNLPDTRIACVPFNLPAPLN